MIISGAKCDVCGEVQYFHIHYGSVNTKKFLREEGWSFGKTDKCPNCSGKKKVEV